MTSRLAAGKRIRSKYLSFATNNLAAGDTRVDEGVDWTVQDDITIIGAQMYIDIDHKSRNTTGTFLVTASLCRSSKHNLDPVILTSKRRIIFEDTTNNVFENPGQEGNPLVMFPEGHGIEVDEGEVVSLLTKQLQTFDTTDASDTEVVCVIWWVER